MSWKVLSIVNLGWLLVVTAGCGESIDPAVSAARGKLLLSTAPAAPQSISQAKESAAESAEVTLTGRIGAGDIDPFDKQVAAFMMSELPSGDHGHGEGHDADNCPFCKRRAAQAPKAHVTLVDDDGQPISIPAPKLLNVKHGDRVIVQGTGKWNPELNVVEVRSRGIYIGK